MVKVRVSWNSTECPMTRTKLYEKKDYHPYRWWIPEIIPELDLQFRIAQNFLYPSWKNWSQDTPPAESIRSQEKCEHTSPVLIFLKHLSSICSWHMSSIEILSESLDMKKVLVIKTSWFPEMIYCKFVASHCEEMKICVFLSAGDGTTLGWYGTYQR